MTAEVDPETVQPYRSENLSLDLRSLALMRIGMGIWILVDLLIRLPDIPYFHTATGYCPINLLPSPHWISTPYYLYRLVDTSLGVHILYLIQALAAVSMMIGYRTRLAVVISWWMLACLQFRNLMIIDGGDIYLRVMMLFACFLPLDAVWSVDARRKNSPTPTVGYSIRNGSTAAFTLQVCIFYFMAAVLKNHPEWRIQGDALYYTLSIEQFSSELGRWMTGYPGLLRILSFAALLIEFTAPLFIVFPIANGFTRSIGLSLLVCLHLGIAATIHLGLFMPACLVVLLGLIPTWLWDSLRNRGFSPDRFEPRQDLRPYRATQALAVSLVIFSAIQNSLTWDELGIKLPNSVLQPAVAFGRFFCMLQNWSLFAPRPFREDGWFAAAGVCRSGKIVNLWNFDSPYPPPRPNLLSTQFKNQRWRRYYQRLWDRDNPYWGPHFLEKRKQEWESRFPELSQSDPMLQCYLVFCQEYTQPPGLPPLLSQYRLGEFPMDPKATLTPVCPKCRKPMSNHPENHDLPTN